MTVTQTVDIPESHRLTIDVPREVPAGPVIIAFTPKADQKAEDDAGLDPDGYCPLCAQYRHPESGRLVPNAKTIAAIEEGRAMTRGEIPAKWYSSAEEMWADLDKDDAD
jgi:hypothetical protein